jgi:hypothetical protein
MQRVFYLQRTSSFIFHVSLHHIVDQGDIAVGSEAWMLMSILCEFHV